MNSKLFGALAVVALLGACAHKPTTTAETPGAGSQTTDQASSSTMSPQDELKNQVGDRVFFGYDKSDISGEARQILERQAAFMQKYPNLTFTIEGHCDPRGTREYNLALGERRATAAKNALVALGVQSSRLQTISYGKERPAVVGDNDAAYAQDRRAVTVIN
jgi:peptidoglycan-associated lipoprotein